MIIESAAIAASYFGRYALQLGQPGDLQQHDSRGDGLVRGCLVFLGQGFE